LIAARSLASRSTCSGHTSASSQPTSPGSERSTG
jgi:hypothetical protein